MLRIDIITHIMCIRSLHMRQIRGVSVINNATVSEKLQWRFIIQCLMRSNTVINVLSMSKLRLEFGYVPGAFINNGRTQTRRIAPYKTY